MYGSRRIIYLENLSFYSSFKESLNTISLVIRTDLIFIFVWWYFFRFCNIFLFFSSFFLDWQLKEFGIFILRIHFSIFFLIGILSISFLDEIKDSSSFELVLFKSTYFRKALWSYNTFATLECKFTTFPNKEVERQQNLA